MATAARKSEEEIVLDDNTPVTEPIEIELPDELGGPTDVELAPEPAPKPEPKPEPQEESPLAAQVEAQRRAEELQRANTDMQRQLAERDAALKTERTQRDDAEYNAVLTAIAAEQATLDKAENDYAVLLSQGNYAGAAKVQRLMTATSARLDRLEDGKSAFEQRKTAPAPEPQRTAPQEQSFEQRISNLPETARSWLRKHPEYINDTSKTGQIAAVHDYLVKVRNIEPFSQPYFDALDEQFGFKAAPQAETQPQRRSMPVSAPVSRDVPSVTGTKQPPNKITLTEEERRIARTSFTSTTMTNAQKELLYAQNKRKLQQRRANGTYPQPERN